MSDESRESFAKHQQLSETNGHSDAFGQKNEERSTKDAKSSVKICRRYLKLIGIWGLNEDGKLSWKILVTNFLSLACYYGLLMRTVPTIFYMIFDTKSLFEMWMVISRLLFSLMTWLKYTFLRLNWKNIQKCMKDIESDWLMVESSASRDIMLEYSRYGSAVTKICAAITYASATFLVILPYMVRTTTVKAVAQDENATEVARVRFFTVPSHFGFAAATVTPIYQVLYTSQIAATFMMQSIAIASYSVVVVTVMHACGQLKILMEKIRSLVDDGRGDGQIMDNDGVNNRLADIVRQHVRILRFISRAEKMLRGVCLSELGCGTVLICLAGYFDLVAWKAERRNLISIVAWSTVELVMIFSMFSYCFVGEILTQQCARVAEIAYMIDWYRLPGRKPLALCLIITMAHRPVALTAGGAIPFSIQCFASVIKTSMGYLNMLREVMD